MPYSPPTKDVVIAALRAVGVRVSEGQNDEIIIESATRLETLVFPPEGLKKHMLFRLKYHYDVPIHWFFHPNQIPGWKPPRVH